MSKDSITGFTIQDEGAASLYLPASFALSPFRLHHLALNPRVLDHSVRIRAEKAAKSPWTAFLNLTGLFVLLAPETAAGIIYGLYRLIKKFSSI